MPIIIDLRAVGNLRLQVSRQFAVHYDPVKIKSLRCKQLFRVRRGVARDFAAAQQTGQLLQASTFIQRLHMGFGHLAIGLFADKEMMVAAACDLRQVGHAHHLRGLAQLAQQLADHGGGRAADADVHFVEDERRVSILRAVIT